MDFRKGVREWVRWTQWGGVTRRDRLISGGFGRTVRDVWEGRMRSGYTLGGGGTRMGYGRLGAGVQDLGRWVVGVMWPWRLLRAPRGAGVSNRWFQGFRGLFWASEGQELAFRSGCWYGFPAWLGLLVGSRRGFGLSAVAPLLWMRSSARFFEAGDLAVPVEGILNCSDRVGTGLSGSSLYIRARN